MNKKTKVSLISVLFFGFIFTACANNLKECEFCGSFYPKDKSELNKLIEDALGSVSAEQIDGEILGLIVPHAGYAYSSGVAAHAYKLLEGRKIDTVIILASCHEHSIKGISVYPDSSFQTPIGNIEVDKELAEKFISLDFASSNKDNFSKEHPIEVELPFIVKTLKNVKVLPVIMGSVDFDNLKRLSEALNEASLKKTILVIASSDLSHFHSYEEAVKIDNETLDFIKNKDTDYLWTSEGYSEGRACGIYPIITLLMYAKTKNADIRILKYANSGDATLEKDKVVGYASAVVYSRFTDKDKMNSNMSREKEAKMSQFTLTKDEKKELLKIARLTLESYLKTGKKPEFKEESKNLQEKRGAFVTLKEKGDLRGCIGRIVADTPLYKVVSEIAVDSAVNDSRFEAVNYRELKDIEIEISVLTPFERVNSLDDIEVGRDGLIIRNGFYSGLLLPQVPVEYGWSKETFLEHLCLKAGLSNDSYKDKNTELYKFSAIVFSESELRK